MKNRCVWNFSIGSASNDAPYIDLLCAKRHKFLLPYRPVLNLLHAHGVSLMQLRCDRSFRSLSGIRFAHSVRKFATALVPQRIAFTMAEILISLTIIGIIAALTLPALQANINEKTWATQRKALYSRMSQAISMIDSLNGYGEFVEADAEHGIEGKDTVTMSFVTNGLSKVLELKNICDNQNLQKCGLPNKIKAANGTTYTTDPNGTNPLTTLAQLNIRFHGTWYADDGVTQISYNGGNINDFTAAAFETKNGESVIAFYNPYCVDFEQAKVTNPGANGGFYVQTQRCMCANFLYDLNGKKGPNQVGKDIGFITALYPTDSEVVAPVNYESTFVARFRDNNGIYQAAKKCKELGDYRLPLNEELMSVFYNQGLIYKTPQDTNYFWSNEQYKIDSEDFAFITKNNTGRLYLWPVMHVNSVLCVKR